MTKILIVGASGQLGSVLTEKLQEKYGIENIVASDLRSNPSFNGCFKVLDATDFEALKKTVIQFEITQIYHLAAILSANGEKAPLNTWEINMKSLFNVLEVSRMTTIEKVFFPSSIAVFGNDAPKTQTPQDYVLAPSTVYGISKVAGENWAKYYFDKYGIDIRSLRYPGIIGHQSLAGGGTTDYAIDMFHKAVKKEPFECYLESGALLPMIYMDDAIRATIELMEAPKERLTVRTSYNLSGMSFAPADLAQAIQRFYPDFEVAYKADFRQKIAESWPSSIDDSVAKADWNWIPAFDIDAMTHKMIDELKLKYTAELNSY